MTDYKTQKADHLRSGTILIAMCQYGIPETGVWFQTAMQVCFWIYASVAVMASASIYLVIWSTQYVIGVSSITVLI
jgi:uncharacterized membrane protein